MKLTGKRRAELSSAAITQGLALTLLCSVLLIVTLQMAQAQPGWWNSRDAVVSQPQVMTNSGGVVMTNNYFVVNQGQLKQFAEQAANELNYRLTNSGGAGAEMSNLVYGWKLDYANNFYNATNIKPSDYQAMNLGQLKYVGNMLWAQLAAAGYTNAVPTWLAANPTSDSMLANIGQVKSVFNFDLSLVGPSGLTASTNSGGTINLSWTLPSTNNATSFIVEQQNTDGSWKILGTVSGTTTTYTVNGLATGENPAFQIIAENSSSYSAPTQTPTDPNLLNPTSSLAVNGPTDGEIDLAWVNNPASDATYILVEQSSDGLQWHVIAQVPASTNWYAVKSLTIGQSYYFGLAAGNN